ncbi:hypothetical protein [Streptomyces sp. NPDC051286]|uniref:hypothetical protein n=1 Tax=Streptomyces sp. NPDC051286 TaxID=3365647 RepID=UPI0037B21EC3
MADSLVERRSIDVVPDDERHGTAFSQFTLWLGANHRASATTSRLCPTRTAATAPDAGTH